jgi:hypothetical protein
MRKGHERICWGALWYSQNLEGVKEFLLVLYTGIPALFRTRREARMWIRDCYGYIARRSDLRTEPHGWRMPRAVRVRVNVVNADTPNSAARRDAERHAPIRRA